MKQDQFNQLFKSGDSGAAWAAVENDIVQKVDLATQDSKAACAAAKKALDALKAQLITAVKDPHVKTDEAVLAIVGDPVKAAKDARIAALERELDELRGVGSVRITDSAQPMSVG